MPITERLILTVSQVNLYIKGLLDRDKYISGVLVKGEISNFKPHTSGHIYMSLKDETGVIRAVMFRSAAAKLRFRPENGMKVIADGRVSVYERDGQYQLYIESMQPDGVGDLHVAFEQLKEKLQWEGLFSPARKKPLPRFPKAVGVVTAPTGAAVRDILNILSRRFPYAAVNLCPVLVQGEQAAGQIVRAIEFFNQNPQYADVLIVGRGGGSIEDLWAFNAEAVARAIYASELPIVSAVGHETDFTIADFAADLRAPTPSAAAELVVPNQAELMEKLRNVYGRLLFCSNKITENRRMRLRYLADKPAMKNPVYKINETRLFLDSVSRNFAAALAAVLEAKKKQCAVAAARLDALSPLAVLSRGYSVTRDTEGKIVRSAKKIRPGDKLSLTFADGEVAATAVK